MEHAIGPQLLEELMRMAVDEAKLSEAEDERAHPSVGAVLADRDGNLLMKAHRGEAPGAHAEYRLLDRAASEGIPIAGSVLFATLEPCTRRGPGKVPCAERIAKAGPAAVYIGTLDPNPSITGRGEMLLQFVTSVGRFPMDMMRELVSINRAFFDEHAHAHAEGHSITSMLAQPDLGLDRNQVLQLTIDLVSASDVEDIWVRAGDLSWFREAFPAFLVAARRGSRIRLLTTAHTSKGYEEAQIAASSIGIELGTSKETALIKGTIVRRRDESESMVLLDAGASNSGARRLLTSTRDRGTIAVLRRDFERAWADSEVLVGRAPTLSPIDTDELLSALSAGVEQYRTLQSEMYVVDITGLRPMTQDLERFKLFRWSRLSQTLDAQEVRAPAFVIDGCPWLITPPVIEERPSGDLVIIDGTHRLYEATRRGVDTMEVIVIRGCAAPLPAKPVAGWSDVTVWSAKRSRAERYDGYDARHFREIRRAFEALALRLSPPASSATPADPT